MEETEKGQWTSEEDNKLVSYIQQHGSGDWTAVSKNTGLHRNGKSCRLRWLNQLNPNIKRGNFTTDEDLIIIRHQALNGNRWSAIAAQLPGRTDNDIKNYWHVHLKKKFSNVNSCSDNYGAEGTTKYEGDVATIGGLDYIKAYYDKMYRNSITGNSIIPTGNSITPPQNQLDENFFDDIGIPTMEEIDRLLLEDPDAPFPPPSPHSAPSNAPEQEGHDYLLNISGPLDHDQLSFGPY
ncbi:hypothetical protein ACET3Z_016437 [Daucus carota]